MNLLKEKNPSSCIFNKTYQTKFSNNSLKFRGLTTDGSISSKEKVTIDKSGKIKVEFKNNFKLHKFEKGPQNYGITTREELLGYYKQMNTMRRLEVVADNLYKSKLIRGFLHLYNGQEAVAVGAEAAIDRDDHVITAYRDHAIFLGRGGTPFECFAELMGRKGGCAHGKGGSMHMYRKEGNFYGGNGIVGAQCPVGAGIAFAQKYFNTGKVCLSYYGDGAANQGQLFEAFNMASLWKLPSLFICENNKYGMGTSAERASANTSYFTRGDYIPGIWIDGMNVIAVREGVKFAADYARKNGPVVIEMETYRYMGHSMSDPGLTYRTRDEVNNIRAERDPIDKVKFFLIESGAATEEELKNIEKDVRKEIDDAAEAAKNSPWPEPQDLYADVYVDKPYFVRAVEQENSVIVQ
jgi:pyruvate dehydrogenase E1 component alpha subunit